MSKIIAFEGIDGSGKTTQISLLRSRLEDKGHSVSVFQDPGTTLLGKEMRKLLFNSKIPRTPLAESLMFLTAKVQLLEEFKKSNSDFLLLDRWVVSVLSYQTAFASLSLSVLETEEFYSKLKSLVDLLELPNPHLTFFLGIKPEDSFERLKGEKDAIESRGLSYLSLVHSFMSRSLDSSTIKIDASEPEERVSNSIWESTLINIL